MLHYLSAIQIEILNELLEQEQKHPGESLIYFKDLAKDDPQKYMACVDLNKHGMIIFKKLSINCYLAQITDYGIKKLKQEIEQKH